MVHSPCEGIPREMEQPAERPDRSDHRAPLVERARACWRAQAKRVLSPLFLLFITIALTYAYFPPTAGWNENSRFNLTRAIVEHGTFFIDAYHLNTGDKSICQGHFCTDKAPGTSIVGVIPYALYRTYLKWTGQPMPTARVIFTNAERAQKREISRWDRVQVNLSFITALYVIGIFTAVLPGALAVVLLVKLLQLLGVGQLLAFGVAALYGLGTITFSFSTASFGHQLAAFLFLWAFYLVMRDRQAPDGSRRVLWGAGFLAGFSCITEYPMAVPLVFLTVFIFFSPRRGSLHWFIFGALWPLAGLSLYLWATFGGPFTLGYHSLAYKPFAVGQSVGLYGVTYPKPEALMGTLFSRSRGLFYISPMLLFSFIGWFKLWRARQHRPVLIFAALMVVYFILLNSSYYMWWGGASAGPRHVVPMLPFFCLPLIAVPTGSRRSWVGLFILLAVISVLNVLIITAAGVKAPEDLDLLIEYAWPTVLGLSERHPNATLGTERFHLSPLLSLSFLILLWGTAALVITQRRDRTTNI